MRAGGDAPVPGPAGSRGTDGGWWRWGVAQEFQRVFTGTTYHCDEDGGVPLTLASESYLRHRKILM
jgi:hypothetical protein